MELKNQSSFGFGIITQIRFNPFLFAEENVHLIR